MIEATLAPADARRAVATLGRLTRAGLREAAVTGGIAVAWHLGAATGRPAIRALNDLDLIVSGASAIAPGLSAEVLVAHVHPDARPGRLLVQVIDPATRLRVDIFGAFGGQLARSRAVSFFDGDVPVVSAGDLVARLAALLLDLGLGEPVPAKHARDFLALQGCIDEAQASSAWADHRRPRQPVAFAEAHHTTLGLIRDRRGLLVEEPRFDISLCCTRCRPIAGLEPASGEAIASALGLR